jgi:spore maturation protein CgeB
MRFLVAHPGPHFSVADVHAGWVEALQAAGQDVCEFPLDSTLTFYNSALFEVDGQPGVFKRAVTTAQAIEMAVDRIYASIMKFRPHVLLVVSAFFLPPELLEIARAAGVRVVIVHTESPYEDERQLAIAGHADLNIVNDPTNLELFRAQAPTHYFWHAYRPSLHHPGPADPKLACEFAFVGTGFPSRLEFLQAMDLTGVDVGLAGNWKLLDEDSPLARCVVHDIGECFDNADTARLYRSAKVGLNLYRREAQAEHLAAGWAMGPREVEMAACGLFFLRDPRPESDVVLGALPTFTCPQDASERLRWWLDHDAHRETAATKAREAIADRTFDAHAARLLRLLEEEL